MREGQTLESAVTFLLADHLGSTTVIIWANGTVRAPKDYAPWGQERWTQNSTPTGYLIHVPMYTGQRWDAGLGLYDYQARYYDPALGKFISADSLIPDPASPQSFNRYAYVLGNPLRFSDPTGHLTQEEIHDYFGYDSRDEMVADGWNEILVDLLFSDDFTWADVFSFDYNGEQVEAILVLFSDGNNTTFRGAFWGLSGLFEGMGLWGTEIQENINRHSEEAKRWEGKLKYGYSYTDIPISESWSYMVPNAYVEFGIAGMGRVMTYTGGGVLAASFTYWTLGLGTPTALGVASSMTTAAGVALQLAVDTGYAEENKLYFIMTYFEPLQDQYNWGLAKPAGQFE